ncbi:hypothetical protein ADH66_19275 [Acutalibacter muris]|uniref:Tn3 transposase DDE domain-containing protein n=1 Tax=Acutalibacter muris TaxID=1796620 RepID=A0ABM6LB48_9FIRM|nr:hypothetical protein ADH66_19275 [Acutalibacter muris]
MLEPDILRAAKYLPDGKKALPGGKFRNMSGTAEHIRLIGIFLWDGFFIGRNVQTRYMANYYNT